MAQQTTSREKEIYKVTFVGGFVNFLLLILKFTAGIVGRSSAMVADAVHSLSDFVTDVIVVFFVHIASKPADKRHTYGHGKYETFATLLVSLSLLVVGALLLARSLSAIVSFLHGGELHPPKMIALVAAVASIVCKEGIYRYTAYKGQRLGSSAIKANAWHHRSDALTSIGTAVGIGGALLLGGKWMILDPLAAAVVSIVIIVVAAKMAKPCFDELMEKSLPEVTEKQIEKIILEVPGVDSPHHLRTRRIGNNYAIEVHIRMDGNISLEESHRRASEIEKKLKEAFGPDTHVGIHMEPRKQN